MDIRSHKKVGRGSINDVKAKVETVRATFKKFLGSKTTFLWFKKALILGKDYRTLDAEASGKEFKD